MLGHGIYTAAIAALGGAFVATGALAALAILGYGLYITVFPLLKTVGGGLAVLGRAAVRGSGPASDVQLGPTLADGGREVEEEVERER